MKRLAADGAIETDLRGRQVLGDPLLNKGTAFSEPEREALGLVGLLPPHPLTIDEQVERAYRQYESQHGDLSKNVFLSLLQDRNEVLFFRLLEDHLTEMLPVVYTPTVGEAIRRYSGEFRRPRGLYLSVDRPDDIARSLRSTGLGPDDVDLIVATDGEAILGIGDWGVGGIAISAGKLAVYTAAAGIDPGRTIAVMLDVGTNRHSLLDDPLYLGNRHERVPVDVYDRFIDAYVTAATEAFPNALLHWEDLGAANARRVLDRYCDTAFTFNDDIQGTGSVTLAAVLSALRVTGGRLADQRVVIHGAGTAGIGIADQLREAMAAEGTGRPDRFDRYWALGSRGLLLRSDERLRDYQRPYARSDAESEGWARDDQGHIGLAEVVRRVQPTILIGTSGQGGSFDEDVVRSMAAGCDRPVIMPMSNPTSLSEGLPEDIMKWTDGRALVATGSPFPPVDVDGQPVTIAQANNALVFPGIGLGAVLAKANRVTVAMIRAAADAVASQVDPTQPGAALLPDVADLRATSAAVGAAVWRAAARDGVAGAAPPAGDLEAVVASAMWEPAYRPVRAV